MLLISIQFVTLWGNFILRQEMLYCRRELDISSPWNIVPAICLLNKHYSLHLTESQARLLNITRK